MTIRLWEISSGTEVCQFPGFQSIPFVAFAPQGNVLASGSADHRVRLWDLAKEQLAGQLVGHQGGVRCVAFCRDGQILASGSQDRTVRLWDLKTGEEFFQLPGHDGWVSSLAFSPDGRMLASASEDRTVRIWDLATGKRLHHLQRHLQRVEAVAFSPDGLTLATCSWDRSIRLWEMPTGRHVHKLLGHRGGVKTVAFSPDGRLLASGGGDATIRLWDVATGEVVRSLLGHQGVVFSVAFSPDGKLLASGGDSSIRLWDVAGGKELGLFQGHQGLVLSVAFSPDGRTVASASTGGSVEIRPEAEDKPKSAAAVDLSELNLEALWDDLTADDMRRALRASRALASMPQWALSFLKGKLQPVPPLDETQAGRWLADLAAADPAAREEAVRQLARLGEPVAPLLHRALADAAPEVKPLLAQVHDRIKHTPPSRETLRDLRAIEVLRKIMGAQSEQLLQSLARGAPGAPLTVAAEAALRRLWDTKEERLKEELALSN